MLIPVFFTGKGDMLLQKHREQQSLERLKLAKHRKKCYANPAKYMGIVIDGMDQKKTRLPHWPRPPKSIDESCLLQMHVVGCLVFHGELHSRVFLNYPSLHNDGNLIVTIMQRIFNEWENKSGGLPPILYLQLDNTSRENKNNLLFTYLHLLVVHKVFRKIKLGFLIVGHTHDQIDQMFSRFSRKLAKCKAFTYDDLCALIQESYTPNPQITLLTETFDFRRFAFSDPSLVVHTLRNITFHHQFKIELCNPGDLVPTQWGKKFSTISDWTPEGGVQLLKEDRAEKIMWASQAMPLCKKGDKVTLSLDEMEKALCEIEKGILGARVLFSEEDVNWWNMFFEEQREFNTSLLVEDRPLKYSFVWPLGENRSSEFQDQIEEVVAVDEAEIDLRVFGPSRDIYVGPYRNPKLIELEKENMDGDFSDLQLNTFIAVPSENCEAKRQFWIARVEKILTRDEKNVPKLISVLWHAVRKGQDSWKGKYAPEVLGFEKKKSKRSKGTQTPIWSIQELDISDTIVFSYNFYLSKGDTLYKKTIDRIEIRLKEYLAEKKAKRAEARLKSKVDTSLPEVSMSDTDEEDQD